MGPMDQQDHLQEQIDELRMRMDAHRLDSEASRADIDQLQKVGAVDRADIDRLQIGAEVNRHLIAELQAEGVLRAEQAEQLQEALQSARMIGSAIGIVMAAGRCTPEEGFQILAKVSQDKNRKLREIAAEVVRTGALP